MPPACQLADMNLRDQEQIIADIDKQIENEKVLAKQRIQSLENQKLKLKRNFTQMEKTNENLKKCHELQEMQKDQLHDQSKKVAKE